MRVLLCGVRGSSTQTGAEFSLFGGDTTCLLVSGLGGERILLDAGSGTSGAGRALAQSPGDRSLLILFTHLHLDHLVGLPSLSQLYDSNWRIRVAVPENMNAAEVITDLMGPPLWPLTPDRMGAEISFGSLPSDRFNHGSITIKHCPIHHPGGGIAYRLDEAGSGKSLVLATDMEWELSSPEERQALVQLCSEPTPADLLICDGQFDQENYSNHRGWGHSRWQDAADLFRGSGVARLLITHHDPLATDDMLSRREADIIAKISDAALARQGDLIEL